MAHENDNEANAGSIGGVAKQCRARFEECLHLQPLVQYEWAENRLAEFNLWAAGTGAFAGERTSLDSRLAHQPDTRDFVINILSLLQGCIEKCRDVALGLHEEAIFKDIPTLGTSDPAGHTGTETPKPPELMPRSFSPWSDMSSTGSWPEETPAGALDLSSSSCAAVQYEVEQVLDSLTRIAVVIRKSGANFRNQKADRLFDPKAHQKLRSHLEILILARGSKTGCDRWDVDARDLTPIQERLIITNLRRRNRFVYAQRHAQKLGIDAEKAHSKSEPSRDDSRMTVDKIPLQTQTTVPEPPALPLGSANTPGASSAIMSATTASAVDSQIKEVPRQGPTPSQTAKTNISSTAARVTYPRPPRIHEGIRSFRCPCCCQILPDLFREATHWKKHLMADICPYTCILEECSSPEATYINRTDWMRHVREAHAQCWECIPCKTPGKMSLMFPSVAEFIDHVKKHHDDTIREDQHQTLIASAAVLAPSGLSSCPLCDETETADSERLLDLVLEHVHEFSIRSLPWPATETEDDENHVWDYFKINDYFDEGTDGQSSRLTVSGASDQDLAGLASLPSNGSSAHSDVEGIYLDSAGDHDFQYTAKSMSFDEAAMPTRQILLDNLRNKILACRKGEDASAIVCFSDLKDVYKGRLQDIQAIARLTTEQATEVLTQMLKLFSFFVILPAPLEWFDQFQSLFFAGASHLPFRDGDMPLREELAADLKIGPFLYRWPEQYLFIPAVIMFDKDHPQLIADKRMRLPYLESLGKYDGAFGHVKCWMLAPEYINNGETQYKKPVAVAVKTFKPSRRGAKEVRHMQTLKESLARSKGLSLHKAILELANGEIKIFLPWAEHGSLDTFLAGGKAPPQGNRYTYDFPTEFPGAQECNDRLATALLEQCVSVADALRFVHAGIPSKIGHIECAHMDLKPDNILIFQGSEKSMVGTWKITDFGISVFNKPTKPRFYFAGTVGDLFREYTMDTTARREQGAYTPPEVHSMTNRDSHLVGRRVNVWAFGAIFAEVLAFALGHAREVARLTAIRRARVSDIADDYFYSQRPLPLLTVPGKYTGELQFELKHGVQDWLFECENKWSDDRPYVKDWVRCVSSALSVDNERRSTATQLLHDVVKIYTSAFAVVGEDLPLQATNETPIDRPDTATTISTFTTTSEAHSNRDSNILNIDFGSNMLDVSLWSPPDKHSTNQGQQKPTTSDNVSATWRQTIDRLSSKLPGAKEIPVFNDRDNVSFYSRISIGKVVAVAIDDERIAALSKNSLSVFKIDRRGNFHFTAERPENFLLLPEGARYERLSISGIYLVVWGSDGITQPCLYVFNGSSWERDRVIPGNFDRSARLALSKNGHVALNKPNEIILYRQTNHTLIGLELPKNPPRLPLLSKQAHIEVCDLAINDAATILYCWGQIGQYGFLHAYELPDDTFSGSNRRPAFSAYFEYHDNERRDRASTKVFPMNDAVGCIVAAAGTRYFPYFPGDMDEEIPGRRNPAISIDCICQSIYGNHSLVVLKQGFRSASIWEYPIDFDTRQFRGGRKVHEFTGRGACAARIIDRPSSTDAIVCFKDGTIKGVSVKSE